MSQGFWSKEAFRAVFLASVLAASGLLLLAWQYNRLAEDGLAELEERVQRQELALEMQKAENAVDAFLGARLVGNADYARQYLTERSWQQVEEQPFIVGRITGYEVLNQEKVGEDAVRFQVRTQHQTSPFSQVETLLARKILDRYYIDSVELAG